MQHSDTLQNIALSIDALIGTLSINYLSITKSAIIMHGTMLNMAFYLWLCWMSLCRVSLCWMSLCWMSLCWMPLCWMPLCWIFHFIYGYAECHYVECHYAECRGTNKYYISSMHTRRSFWIWVFGQNKLFSIQLFILQNQFYCQNRIHFQVPESNVNFNSTFFNQIKSNNWTIQII
jgi:hypothetical protein